jgi:hypothetical protein
MAFEKSKLKEKFETMTPEERSLFRETLLEIDPPDTAAVLTVEEVGTLRELLSKKGKKKDGGLLAFFDSLME